MNKKIDAEKATKVMGLLARVIKLNDNAEPDIYYSFDYTGGTNGVYFSKIRRNQDEYKTLFTSYAYLDYDHLGQTLDGVEAAIASEERSQWERRKYGGDEK